MLHFTELWSEILPSVKKVGGGICLPCPPPITEATGTVKHFEEHFLTIDKQSLLFTTNYIVGDCQFADKQIECCWNLSS